MNNFLGIVTFLYCAITVAQTPGAFNYQAVARDATGKILENKAISIEFRILEGNSKGTTVYKETHKTTTTGYGLFTLEVGTGTRDNKFKLQDIGWGSGQYWLQVGIDPDAGNSHSIIGSSQLLSVPYALHADTVTNDQDTQYTAGAGLKLVGTEFSLADQSFLQKMAGTSPFSTVSAITSNALGDISRDSFVFGSSSINDIPGTDDNKRVIFCKNEGAFRAGEATGTQWDITNVGDWSTAFGYDTTASGRYSSAFGYQSSATGVSSFAVGYQAKASSNYNTAIGYRVKASGSLSLATGHTTEASGVAATSMGYETKSTGVTSSSFGFRTTASGDYSIAMGLRSVAEGDGSFAAGQDSKAIGSHSAAFGGTNAIGINSLSSGSNSEARGGNSAAFGESTISEAPAQFTVGTYNIESGVSSSGSGPESKLFVVGNGSFASERKDAFVITRNGNAALAGTLTQNSDRRLKINITPLENTLEKIEQINGVNYLWKDIKNRGDELQLGVIAQEVQAQYPELVTKDTQGTLSVNYNGLVPVLLEAIKELKTKLEVSENRNDKLASELSLLTSKVSIIMSELSIDTAKK